MKVLKVWKSSDSGIGSLRQAILEANSLPSAKILICLEEKIQLQSQLIIRCPQIKIKSKSEITITSEDRIFFLSSQVQRFELKKLNLSSGKSNQGGAIYSSSEGQIILKSVKLTNNRASSGGAIYTLGSLIILESIIKKNQALYQGGGIWAAKSILLDQSCVSKNQVTVSSNSSGGGGIYLDQGDLILTQSKISSNSVNDQIGGSGGGLIVMSGNIYLQNGSQVSSNWAYNSGGIQEGIGNIYLEKSQIIKNYSTNPNNLGGGAGINITYGTVSLSQSEISYNKSSGMMSGGIVSFFGDILVNQSAFINNFSNGPGGALAGNFDSSIVITDSQIKDNLGGSLGGAIVNFSLSTTGIISITRSTLRNNLLNNSQTIGQTIAAFLSIFLSQSQNISEQSNFNGFPGGQEYIALLSELIPKATAIADQLQSLFPGEQNFIAGGAIATLLDCPIVIDQSTIAHNSAQATEGTSTTPLGGAIAAFNGPISIINSEIKDHFEITTFSRKSSNFKGEKIKGENKDSGAVWSQKELTLNKSIIADNCGSGIINLGKATILNSTLSDNRSKNNGGGINNQGELILLESQIDQNKAKNGGGVYSTTAFTSLKSTIVDNSPNNLVIKK